MIHYRKGQWHEGPIPMDPTGEAFRFGAGFFETLLYNGARIMHPELHRQRLRRSLDVFEVEYELPDMESIGMEAVRRNGLEGREARVNVFCPVEHGRAEPVIMAAPFERPEGPLRLRIHPDPVLNPLAEHKCMNYYFLLSAHNSATAHGFHDAVLVTPGGELLESCFAALVFRRGNALITPGGPNRLPSTALAAVRKEAEIWPEFVSTDLRDFDACYTLNSLGGVMPVSQLGEKRFEPDLETCAKLSPLVTGI